MNITNKQYNDAANIGEIRLQDGACLATAEHMISDQKDWDEDDNYKNFDFTTSDFWIVTDGRPSDGCFVCARSCTH